MDNPDFRQSAENFNLSNFFYEDGEDLFSLIHSFNTWHREALRTGYNQYSMPLLTAPLSEVRLLHPDTLRELSFINLSSYNYLGISTRQEVIDAAKVALDFYGLGASGSPILSGTYQIGNDFAAQVAKFKNKESAVIFQTGYGANLGFISSIMRPGDTIILDQFAHASIVDGAILSRAHISYFKHNDLRDLEKKLIRAKGKKLVVVEGVYSMDGDFCPLVEIVNISKKYDAMILLDEAHSAFIYGKNGRGLAELLGLEDEIDFHMGTFSKSLGGIGGYICASAEVVNYVTAYARSRFFSCNLPPSMVAGLSKALEIAIAEPVLREKLAHNVTLMKDELARYNIDTSHSQSQIIPLIIGNESKTFRIAKKILNEGIYVIPIVYPAVTKNKGRLRISVSATLDDAQIERATSIIAHAIQNES